MHPTKTTAETKRQKKKDRTRTAENGTTDSRQQTIHRKQAETEKRKTAMDNRKKDTGRNEKRRTPWYITTALGMFLVLLPPSCHIDTHYHEYRPVECEGWNTHDTLVFALPHTPPEDSRYRLGIRHLDSYPYRDLWLNVNGDTLHVHLADIQGKWHGSGIGELRQYTVGIPTPQTNDTLKEIRITHIMKHNPLPGIHDIGIQIQKVKTDLK